MLLTAGLNDTRVGYWEPAKFTARLRSLNPENPVLLRTEMDVGHGGPSGRYSAWREEAFVLAWMFDQFTITE
jgi:oligopeptidase B